MRSRTLRLRLPALTLAFVLLAAWPAGATSSPLALPPDDVDFLIVTNAEMAPAFAPLAAVRDAEGLRSRVVTIEWIASVTPAGADLQETLREFLRAAYLDWGIRYLLLGGDDPVLPDRLARTDLRLSEVPPDVPSDLYYACLNGNWDADGDGLYAEYIDDETDLVPELRLGRAPVSTEAEAAVFVNKTLAYAAAERSDRLDDALLLAEVLAPYPWHDVDPIAIDGAAQAEALASLLAGADRPFRTCRLYQNWSAYPGALPLGRQAVVDSLGSGRYGLVGFVGHSSLEGWSVGAPDLLTAGDLAGLGNGPATFVVEGIACHATAFPDTCMAEMLLRDPDGGCVAALGPSGVTFLVPACELQEAFFTAATAAESGPLGDLLVATLATVRDRAASSLTYHHVCLSYLLLGDPTLRLGSPVATGVPAPVRDAVQVRVERCVPNPFNPLTRIRFTIQGPADAALPTVVTIYDLRGRPVRTLLRRLLAAGDHEVTWNGSDDAGREAPSALYLVRVEAAGVTDHGKVMLAR